MRRSKGRKHCLFIQKPLVSLLLPLLLGERQYTCDGLHCNAAPHKTEVCDSCESEVLDSGQGDLLIAANLKWLSAKTQCGCEDGREANSKHTVVRGVCLNGKVLRQRWGTWVRVWVCVCCISRKCHTEPRLTCTPVGRGILHETLKERKCSWHMIFW